MDAAGTVRGLCWGQSLQGDMGTTECALSCHSASTSCPSRGPGGVPTGGQGTALLAPGLVPPGTAAVAAQSPRWPGPHGAELFSLKVNLCYSSGRQKC